MNCSNGISMTIYRSMWYKIFDSFVLGLEIFRSKSYHYMCYKHDGGHFLVITLCVDHMLLFGNNKDVIHDFNYYISTQFDMKDWGLQNMS